MKLLHAPGSDARRRHHRSGQRCRDGAGTLIGLGVRSLAGVEVPGSGGRVGAPGPSTIMHIKAASIMCFTMGWEVNFKAAVGLSWKIF